jgi:hypothetical protein
MVTFASDAKLTVLVMVESVMELVVDHAEDRVERSIVEPFCISQP